MEGNEDGRSWRIQSRFEADPFLREQIVRAKSESESKSVREREGERECNVAAIDPRVLRRRDSAGILVDCL